MAPILGFKNDDRDTNIGQTWLQMVNANGPVHQDFATTVASGDGALANNGAIFSRNFANGNGNLFAEGATGTTIVNGPVNGPVLSNLDRTVVGNGNQAVMGEDNTTAFGNGDAISAENVNKGNGVLVDEGNANTGSGDLTQLEDSNVSESAFGHGQVQSNDQTAWASDGAAVSFGSGAPTGAGDTTIAVAGSLQDSPVTVGDANQVRVDHDESTRFDLAVDDHSDNSADWNWDDHSDNSVALRFLNDHSIKDSLNPAIDNSIDMSDDDIDMSDDDFFDVN